VPPLRLSVVAASFDFAINAPQQYRLRLGFVAYLVAAAPLLTFLSYFLMRLSDMAHISLGTALDSGEGPLARSLGAGVLSATLTIIVALGIARSTVALILGGRVRAVGIVCALLSLAVTPLLIGTVSYAFLLNIWLRSTFAALDLSIPHTAEGVIGLVGIAGGLRYSPLLAWLLVVSVLFVDPMKRSFGNSIGMSSRDFIRAELVWPWAVISILVGAFAFQDAATDYAVSYLTLRPSPATSTELLAHYSNRSFISLLTSRSGSEAIHVVILQSAVAAIFLLGVFAVLAAQILLWARRAQLCVPNSSRRRVTSSMGNASLLFPLAAVGIFISITLSPPLGALAKLTISFKDIDPRLFGTFSLAAAVSIMGWVIAAAATYLLREMTRLHDGSAERGLGVVGILASSTGFLPTLGLAVATYSLLFMATSFVGGFDALVGWMASQLVKLLPILCLFMIPSVLGVSDAKIHYLQDAGARLPSRIWHVYVRPNLPAHFALILLGWNLVINESLINAAFQADLPSYSELVTRATSGRSAAYGTASALIGAQTLIFATMCALWGMQIFKYWRARNDLG
jgi:hypothetical protein